MLQSHGSQQMADVIGKVTNAISNWTERDDAHRKDLLENVAQVSKEASSQPDQRRPGVLKASLAFLTTSLSTAKELIPLVHDLHEKLKAALLPSAFMQEACHDLLRDHDQMGEA